MKTALDVLEHGGEQRGKLVRMLTSSLEELVRPYCLKCIQNIPSSPNKRVYRCFCCAAPRKQTQELSPYAKHIVTRIKPSNDSIE